MKTTTRRPITYKKVKKNTLQSANETTASFIFLELPILSQPTINLDGDHNLLYQILLVVVHGENGR